MTEDEIRALLARQSEAIVRQDTSALAAFYSDDCVVMSPMWGTITGRAAIESLHEAIFSSFPDSAFQIEDPVVLGNQAIRLATWRGTDTGGLLGQAPTGKPFSVLFVSSMTFGKDQIVYERRIYDRGGLLLQLVGEAGEEPEASRLYRSTLDRALLAHEVSLAAQIQQALLPPALFAGAGFEIAAASIPCRTIGGDFIDYYDLPTGAFGFALGDISGKGPPAALLAGVLQGILAGHVPIGGTPAKTLTHVNDVLLRRTAESRFATVVYGHLAEDGRLTYCNAGHNPPLLIGHQRPRRLEKGGLILGAFKDAAFEEEIVQLQPGDVLVLFSDGVTEAVNDDGEEFGEDRVLACLQSHRDLRAAEQLERLFETLRQFTDHTPQRDDVTALVLRYIGGAG